MDASSLSAYDDEKLKRAARRAGEAAAAEKARELMPFSDQSPSLQKLAAWMTTLGELKKFHKTTLNGDREKVRSSIELWWGAQLRGGHMQGGVIRQTFDPRELGGSFEQCCLKIAAALGNYHDSDEIHEVRGGFWVLRAPSVEIVGKGMDERAFAYKPARGKFGDELRGIRGVFTKDKEQRRDAELQRQDDQLAITVAAALGFAKDLESASKAAYDKSYGEGKEVLLKSREKPEKEPKNRPWNR